MTSTSFLIVYSLFTYNGDSLDHVCDMGADSVDGSEFLLASTPLLNQDGALVLHLDVHRKMAEVADQLSACTLHCDSAGLDRDCHCRTRK